MFWVRKNEHHKVLDTLALCVQVLERLSQNHALFELSQQATGKELGQLRQRLDDQLREIKERMDRIEGIR